MQKTLILKALVVALLALILLIPMAMIDGLVRERQSRQHETTAGIAASYAGEQRIAGPMLVLPYTEEYRTTEIDPDTKTRREVWKREERQLVLLPETLAFDGNIDTAVKSRGIFHTRVFESRNTLAGRFRLPAEFNYERRDKDSRIVRGQPYVALGITDPRGLRGAPTLELDGKPVSFVQGSGYAALPNGIRANVDLPAGGGVAAYSLKLNLSGTEQFAVVPLADDNRLSLKSSWPHPGFGGQFLPDPSTQKIGADGFNAQWQISSLASRAQSQVMDANCRHLECLDTASVRFVDPVNVYSLSDRAVKYDILFVVLTFAGFFLYEMLRRLPIHPAQYLLVGLAIAIFFLLLLALSEHIAFGLAYAIAAAACVALVSFYLSGVMKSWKHGAGFGAMLGGLYGALYGLLQSEDNAMLMGSLLMFVLLATAMTLTRRFDWYRLAPAEAAVPQS